MELWSYSADTSAQAMDEESALAYNCSESRILGATAGMEQLERISSDKSAATPATVARVIVG